jgi:hypothetical protein
MARVQFLPVDSVVYKRAEYVRHKHASDDPYNALLRRANDVWVPSILWESR